MLCDDVYLYFFRIFDILPMYADQLNIYTVNEKKKGDILKKPLKMLRCHVSWKGYMKYTAIITRSSHAHVCIVTFHLIPNSSTLVQKSKNTQCSSFNSLKVLHKQRSRSRG